MSQNQRGPFQNLDNLGHREGFSAARHPQQHLVFLVVAEALHQFGDSRALVTPRS